LKILLSAKEVKGEIVPYPLLSHVADFHLKWSMLMENPKNAITGRSQWRTTPIFQGGFYPPKRREYLANTPPFLKAVI